MSRAYKNLTQRAKRYARGKHPGLTKLARSIHYNSDALEYERLNILADSQIVAAQGFRDGYKLAMKEIRQLIATNAVIGSSETYHLITNFVNDSERLK